MSVGWFGGWAESYVQVEYANINILWILLCFKKFGCIHKKEHQLLLLEKTLINRNLDYIPQKFLLFARAFVNQKEITQKLKKIIYTSIDVCACIFDMASKMSLAILNGSQYLSRLIY